MLNVYCRKPNQSKNYAYVMVHLSQKSNSIFSHPQRPRDRKRRHRGWENSYTSPCHSRQPVCSEFSLCGILWVPGRSSPASVLSSDRTEGKHASQRKSWSWPSVDDGRQHSTSQVIQRRNRKLFTKRTRDSESETHGLNPSSEQTQCMTLTKHSLFSKVASLAPSI